jgi:hypothetical protein
LLRLETLEEIALLTAPEPGIIVGLELSPDGRHLFAAVANTVQHWDLHALRRGLRGIGLDWDLPPYPPAGSQDDASAVRVEVQPPKSGP